MLIAIFVPLFCLALVLSSLPVVRRHNGVRWVVPASCLIGVFTSATLLLVVVAYAASPHFLDHFESVIAQISWLGAHGGTVYPAYESGTLYEAPYGPLLFLINGGILRWTDSIQAFKATGCIVFALSFLPLYLGLRSRSRDDRMMVALGLLLCAEVYLSFHGPAYPFWGRAEPFLILLSSIAVFAEPRVSRWRAVVASGLLAGLSSSFKLHGGIYILPMLLSGVASFGPSRQGLVALACAGLTAVVVMAVSFVPLINAGSLTELRGYVDDLLMSSRQGLSYHNLLVNLATSTLLAIPTLIVLAVCRPTLDRRDSFFLAGFGLALVCGSVIGSKAGAGAYHLLPLVPPAAYSLVTASSAPWRRADRFGGRAIPLALFVMCFGMVCLRSNILFAGTVFTTLNDRAVADQKVEELRRLAAKYPSAQVGVSDDAHFDDYAFRVYLVQDGLRPRVDFSSLMDWRSARYPEGPVDDLLAGCSVPSWIMPVGEPFSMREFYLHRALMSDRFRAAFFERYRLVDQGRFFQVWGCAQQQGSKQSTSAVPEPR